MSQYTIIAKKLHGINIQGFLIEDDEHNEKVISYDECAKLARIDKISNAKMILDVTNGEYILSVDGGYTGLETLHSEYKYKASGRLIKNNKCVGYTLVDNSGKSYKISINKVWELASNNEIENLKGVIINKHKILKGAVPDFIQSINRMET